MMAACLRYLIKHANCLQCFILRLNRQYYYNPNKHLSSLQSIKLKLVCGIGDANRKTCEDFLKPKHLLNLVVLNKWNSRKRDSFRTLSSDSKEEFARLLSGANHHTVIQEPRPTAIPKDEYYKSVWKKQMNQDTSCEPINQNNFEIERSEEDFQVRERKISKALPENVFGTLKEKDSPSFDHRDHNERLGEIFSEEEERDWRKNIPLSKYGRKSRPADFYNKKIKMFASQGKIKEAIKVLDTWMLVEDRVKPNKATFVTLITHLAKLGHAHKTFHLYWQMKQFGLDPPDRLYPLLFYSCENCPMPDYGLNRANNLYHYLTDSGLEIGLPTVKSAMRAFAKCGDFAKAFQILDEQRYPLDIEFFNALLMACISDKQAGFKRALQVWMLMGEYNIKPEGLTYNLLARCVRDCRIGEPSKFTQDVYLNSGQHGEGKSRVGLFDAITGTNIFLHGTHPKYLPLNDNNSKQHARNQDTKLSKSDSSYRETVPCKHNQNRNEYVVLTPALEDNILSQEKEKTNVTVEGEHVFRIITQTQDKLQNKGKCHESFHQSNASMKMVGGKSDIVPFDEGNSPQNQLSVEISDLTTAAGRLSLLGGMESFLSHMEANGVHADVKTYTLLLSALPNNKENEMKLLELMENVGVKPEIDFLNDVMMRRNKRNEGHTLKDVLGFISTFRLTPNMRTYAALAMSCLKEEAGMNLLEDMKAANLEPTTEVMGHFIFASKFNFKYKLRLLKVMEDLNVKPDEQMIKAFEKSIAKIKQKIAQAEKKGGPDWLLSPSFQKSFQQFLRFYRPWLMRTTIHKPQHPWHDLGSGENP